MIWHPSAIASDLPSRHSDAWLECHFPVDLVLCFSPRIVFSLAMNRSSWHSFWGMLMGFLDSTLMGGSDKSLWTSTLLSDGLCDHVTYIYPPCSPLVNVCDLFFSYSSYFIQVYDFLAFCDLTLFNIQVLSPLSPLHLHLPSISTTHIASCLERYQKALHLNADIQRYLSPSSQ